ncbi:hypothetical protein ACYATP_02895 [Lactobacillaceae bacterium Melli_B4]
MKLLDTKHMKITVNKTTKKEKNEFLIFLVIVGIVVWIIKSGVL